MGGCLTTQQPSTQKIEGTESMGQAVGLCTTETTSRQPAEGEASPANAPEETVQEMHLKQQVPSSIDVPSSTSSDMANRPPVPEGSYDRLAPSSDGSRTPGDPGASPRGMAVRSPLGTGQNAALTESALRQLNQSSVARKGRPSSTGGTTANTRPTDLPDVPELADVPEAAEMPIESEAEVTGVHFVVPEDMPQGTPPPVPEGLPVVSLHDIAVMEQKQGRRGMRVKSRRGSTTASHASLSAIPENLEITPLHARSERSDSMRVTLAAQTISRLADVQELEVCMPCRL
jgi:hypothetical protein